MGIKNPKDSDVLKNLYISEVFKSHAENQTLRKSLGGEQVWKVEVVTITCQSAGGWGAVVLEVQTEPAPDCQASLSHHWDLLRTSHPAGPSK